MKNQLEQIRQNAQAALEKITSKSDLEQIRVQFLGKKGELTGVLKQMGRLTQEERPIIGQLANEVREYISGAIAEKSSQLEQLLLESKLASEKIDVTMPGRHPVKGHKHPMNIVLDEVKDIFVGMGFEIADGPEIETTYYNFTALNTPEGHPAREMQDSFYINPEVLLRTQTSSVQIRVMEHRKPPIRMISPGRVYRKDELDATHSPMFHQIEGLVVDKGITMADLKGTLETLIKKIYGEDAKIRLRPHHFPFTEPSCEVDVMCFKCHGAGCTTCKGEGWIELLGAGMVHPNVLRMCGIDPQEYSGFAFGVGLERLVMRRFAINDLRLFFENDVRFLNQF